MAASVSAKVPSRVQSNWSRRLSYVQDAALVCVSALFFYVHARHVIESHSVTNVFFAVEQGLLVGMFLMRRRSENTSTRPADWVVATIGGWLPLALRPHETGGSAELIGAGISMIGLTCVIVSFATLGKSFGVVAANRGLKVGGPYQFIRHPIYFSHATTMTGFVVANFWSYNVAILAIVTTFQVLRIAAEERVLVATSDYASYKARVRWRLVPGLY
ncbi:isoprenylcysteine carboxylmethyltransferase family protein [Candidatus Amarobacter glycogenicus]|uniref:methyltransferase family protein n=1 Tax=Candidatus Amarobacter glycogenicus TaxID=3140699 RepID=UPI00313526E8|nr:isoprenylcysteine carboxylmethyltransferase family protein [Dehalococcoidia bacterium]